MKSDSVKSDLHVECHACMHFGIIKTYVTTQESLRISDRRGRLAIKWWKLSEVEGSIDHCYTTTATHIQTWGGWNNLYRSRISGTHSSYRQRYSLTTCHKHSSLVIVNKLEDKINIDRVSHNTMFWVSHDYVCTRSMKASIRNFYWVLLRGPTVLHYGNVVNMPCL